MTKLIRLKKMKFICYQNSKNDNIAYNKPYFVHIEKCPGPTKIAEFTWIYQFSGRTH